MWLQTYQQFKNASPKWKSVSTIAVVMVDESGDIIRDVRSDLKGDIDALQADMDAADRRNRELDKEVPWVRRCHRPRYER